MTPLSILSSSTPSSSTTLQFRHEFHLKTPPATQKTFHFARITFGFHKLCITTSIFIGDSKQHRPQTKAIEAVNEMRNFCPAKMVTFWLFKEGRQ
jgi:hypothetical protein